MYNFVFLNLFIFPRYGTLHGDGVKVRYFGELNLGGGGGSEQIMKNASRSLINLLPLYS